MKAHGPDGAPTGVPAWVRDAVFYQIFPDRFAMSERVAKPGPLEPWDAPPTRHGFKGGDLYGVVERLDYLADLGITALYLNPIFASAANHRYHTYDYLAVDPLLGGNEALRVLLDACHARGMRVILDGVFNHSGRGFWPFHHLLENGRHSPYRDWFYVDDERLERERRPRAYPDESLRDRIPGSPAADPPASGSRSRRALGYQAWWDLPGLPKLRVENPEVREYLLRVAEHWVRFGIDGWRLDVPSEIEDDDFWREFRGRVRAANPEAYIVGELWRESGRWLRGDMFDAVMNYPLAEAILSFVSGEHLDSRVLRSHDELRRWVRRERAPTFARRLEQVMTAYAPEVTAAQLNLIGSHDTPRFRTLCGGDRAALRMALLTVMTLPGAPMVYYGDEIGLEGGHDPANRGAFPIDPGSHDPALLAYARTVIALRHANPVLRHGSWRLLNARGGACVYLRTDARGASAVIGLNAGETAATLRLGVDLDGFEPMPFPGDSPAELTNGRMTMPPRQGAVWLGRGGRRRSGPGRARLGCPPRQRSRP